ncbi:DUF2225 domain-containing protein, partial [bacterium]|nr:DUF2225 domain-containing protein [bacterium]
IAKLCGFTKEFLKSATDWCHRGIVWKQNKNPLIANCKFSAKQRSAPGCLLGQNPDNNSILDREFGCYICDSKEKVKIFQLKPHSQEPNRNIFGIIAYFESLGDHDYIDYNLVKIFICPTCYFASAEKDLFKKLGKDESSKTFANKQFKEFWLKDIDQRKSLFKDSREEISSIKRSLATVVKSYTLAIKAAKALSKLNKDQSFDWQVVTLLLTLSEILMSNGNEEKAEEYLEQARVVADDLFKNASNTLIAIRSARLLFFIALYQNDLRIAGPFVDYIRQLYQDNFDSLKQNEQVVLKKVFGETQKALKDRSDYKKENLFGFHMEV